MALLANGVALVVHEQAQGITEYAESSSKETPCFERSSPPCLPIRILAYSPISLSIAHGIVARFSAFPW
ncbi:MAG: hypothetical protein ACXVZT_07460, partial [Terriglobales bacterium]